MNKGKVKSEKRQRRRIKVRSRVSGTEKRPRLSVFRSLRGIQVQLVDDASGKTLVSAGSKDKEIEKLSQPEAGQPLAENKEIKGDANNSKVSIAFVVGELLAKKALEKNIKRVVFDRGGYKYHGRVKAIAEGARRGGLKF
ncbi:50S ribosomal protein L18 [Candidatus Falkowbacteria bacterium]|nr:50S ribosomal protein L18 [Candidatus Falkowbacteria bacterium]